MAKAPGVRIAAALAWCAFCVWWAYGRGLQVPLLAHVDLGFHELGHLVFYIVPISDLVTATAGSAMQLAVPIGLACYFGWWRGDRLAASVCLVWAATSARDVSIYVADAPYEHLPLIGGEHDWAYILGPDQLDRLDQAGRYAELTRGFGLVVVTIAAALIVDVLIRHRTPNRDTRAAPITVLDAPRERVLGHDGTAGGVAPRDPTSVPSETSLAHDHGDRLALDRPQSRPL